MSVPPLSRPNLEAFLGQLTGQAPRVVESPAFAIESNSVSINSEFDLDADKSPI